MPAIFISHSSVDRAVSDKVKAALARLGFERVFLDFDKTTGIGVGDNWEKRLYEELSRCHAVLLLLTPAWVASKWCFVELAQARALGKVILPVLCAPLGGQVVLPEVQAVDLVDWNADGLTRLEQRLRAISNELARGFTLDPSRPPYPGIFAFEAEDAAIYFGRDEETRAVIERLDARRTQGGARFVIIIGASGTGKSSLLKASVLPQLGRRRAHWVLLPCIRPEKAPLEPLAKAVAQYVSKPEAWREWHERLSGPDAVAAIERLTQDARISDTRAATVLLPIDQFEEVFTATGAAERAAFLTLLAAVFDRDIPFMVVATGRSDVLEGLVESSELVHRYEPYPLAAMPLDRVPRLVEGPAAVAGLNVEKGLSERIVRDVESTEALPLLAHMLSLLYQRGGEHRRLAIAEYDALGDPARGLNPIQNSVRLAADEAIARVKPSEQELAALRDAFVPHLVRVRLDDGKRVRQPARRSELPRGALQLIGVLVEARLLSTRGAETGGPGSDTLVEVTHEALFKAWPMLDQWLTEEQAFLTDIERIRDAHENWSQAPAEQKSGELLYGLLLSRARDWLLKYPQRFLGRGMGPLRAYIAASADVADAERARVAAAETRRRRIERGALAGTIAAVVMLVILLWFAITAQQSAVVERDRAQVLSTVSLARQLAAQAVMFGTELRSDLEPAALLAVEAMRRFPHLESDRALRDSTRRLALQTQRMRHDSPVRLVTFSPDARWLATGSDDKTVRVFEAVNGKEAWRRELGGVVNAVAFSVDGRSVATAGGDGFVRVFEAATWNELWHGRHDGPVSAVAFSADGLSVVTGSQDKTLRVFGMANGAENWRNNHSDVVNMTLSAGHWIVTASSSRVRVFDAMTHQDVWNSNQQQGDYGFGDHGTVSSLALSAESGLIAVGRGGEFNQGGWQVVEVATGRLVSQGGFEGAPASIALGAGGRLVAIGGQDKKVHVVEVGTGKEVFQIAHGDAVTSIAFSPDGSMIATSSKDGNVRLVDVATGAEEARLTHEGPVMAVAFGPDGRQVASASEDGTARILDASSEKAGPHLTSFGGRVESVAFSSDGRWVMTRGIVPEKLSGLGFDMWAGVFDATTGKPILQLDDLHLLEGVSAMDIAGNGRRVAVVGNTIQMFDPSSEKEVWRGTGPVVAVAFSPDGSRVATGGKDAARVLDAATGKELLRLPHDRPVTAVAFSADAKWLATGSEDSTRIFDAMSGTEVQHLNGTGSFAGISADGARIVTVAGSIARVFEMASGKELSHLILPEPERSLKLSGDGRWVAMTSGDSTRVFDTVSGKEMARMIVGDDAKAVLFADQGRYLMIASLARSGDELVITRHRFHPQDMIDDACARLTRNLTQQEWGQYIGSEPPYHRTCPNLP